MHLMEDLYTTFQQIVKIMKDILNSTENNQLIMRLIMFHVYLNRINIFLKI